MPVTVNINGLSSVHQGSGGIATATLPDVCKTPPNSAPVPYPNVALSADLVGGTTTVSIDGSPAAVQSSMFVKSTGDEAGALGGVVSSVFAMEATFISFSPTVSFEGQPACRLTDKMLMNKANTVCMSGVAQAPLPPMRQPPPGTMQSLTPGEPIFCPVAQLIVSCGHADRDLTVDLIAKDLPLLQVLSEAASHDKLLLSVDSSCGFGHKHCPTMLIGYPDGSWKPLDGGGVLDLDPPLALPFAPEDWVIAFIALMIDRQVARQVYSLWPLICNGDPTQALVPIGEATRIEVYPELSCGGDLSLEYSRPKISDETKTLDYKREKTWKFGGSIAAKIGTHSMTYEASLKKKGVEKVPFIGQLIDKLGKTAFLFDSMKQLGVGAKGDIQWPSLKLSSELELVELSGKPEVGTSGKFKLACAPLIGLQFNVSLLDYLIRFAGSFAPIGGALLAEALIMVKERASSYGEDSTSPVQASADVEIELIVKGDINGAIGVKFVEGEAGALDKATGLDGGISLQLEARIILKAKIWKVEFGGGAKVGAAAASGDGSEGSRIGAKLKPKFEKDTMRVVGELYFTGLAVYYVLYLELAGTGLENKTPKSKDKDKDEAEFESGMTDKSKFERKGSCVLLEAWEWSPKAPSGSGASGW
jgi:uncharacterized Zn-binding protein involved in type VI secretion